MTKLKSLLTNKYFWGITGFFLGVIITLSLTYLANILCTVEWGYFKLTFPDIFNALITLITASIVAYLITKRFNRSDRYFQIHYDKLIVFEGVFGQLCEIVENSIKDTKIGTNGIHKTNSLFTNLIIDIGILKKSSRKVNSQYTEHLSTINKSIEELWESLTEEDIDENGNKKEISNDSMILYHIVSEKVKSEIQHCKIALHSE